MEDSTPEQVCTELFSFLERVKQAIGDAADKRGLTRPQLFVLYWIDRDQEVSMGSIAEKLHCDASNITGIVDRLAAQHLVLRQECTHDRRTKTIRLTERGKGLVGDFRRELPILLGCSALPAKEQAALVKIMAKIGAPSPGV